MPSFSKLNFDDSLICFLRLIVSLYLTNFKFCCCFFQLSKNSQLSLVSKVVLNQHQRHRLRSSSHQFLYVQIHICKKVETKTKNKIVPHFEFFPYLLSSPFLMSGIIIIAVCAPQSVGVMRTKCNFLLIMWFRLII